MMSCLICHSLICICGLEDIEPESPFDIVREARQPKLAELSTAELPVQGEAVAYIDDSALELLRMGEHMIITPNLYHPDSEYVKTWGTITKLFTTPTLKPSVNELVEGIDKQIILELKCLAEVAEVENITVEGNPLWPLINDAWKRIEALASHQSAKEQV
jgi:nucleotide-binding universal stress UspA family protein